MVLYAAMESRFLMTGAVASVALHVTLLALLSAGPCRAVQRAVSDDGPETGVPATNALAAAAAEAGDGAVRREAKPVSEPDVAPGPDREPVPGPDRRASGVVLPEERPPAQASGEPPVAVPDPKAETVEWATYVVKRGDTLTGLVRDTGCTLEQVAQKNGKSVKALARLKVGQRIKLPRRPR